MVNRTLVLRRLSALGEKTETIFDFKLNFQVKLFFGLLSFFLKFLHFSPFK